MKVLIVYAHMEEGSFNAAMLDAGVGALERRGHEVVVSDLYRMGFDPVARPDDFLAPAEPGRIRYDIEQRHAVQAGGFAPALQQEIDRLLWCDLLILQFPFYWFSVPAIMKGWIDKVFVNGIVYGGGKWYDRGGLSGRKAMLAFSTGCFPTMCGPDGINGDMEIMLWPLQNGTLRFSGMTVLPPFIAYSVAYHDDEARDGMVAAYARRLDGIEDDRPLDFHHRDEFSKDWRLKPGIAPRAVGQIKAAPR